MVKRVSIIAAMLLAGTAHADSYVSAGIVSGVGYTVDWLYAGPQLEVGIRGNDHTWLHAAAALIGRAGYGTTQDLTIQVPQDRSSRRAPASSGAASIARRCAGSRAWTSAITPPT
jgi:hypothetical protein